MTLLNTHVFIWLVNDDEKLVKKYKEFLLKEQNLYLSVIS